MNNHKPKCVLHIEVQSWQDLSPHLRRIVFFSPELADYPFQCKAAHIKLLFPQPGQDKPVLPVLTPRGPVWPEGAQRSFDRAYTLRDYDAGNCTITVDFVRHGDTGGSLGPAARFVEQVAAGQIIAVSPPAGPVPMLKPAARYILVGDATALPAIHAMLEDMDSHAVGDVFLWLPEVADLPALPLPAGVRLHTFFGDLTQVNALVAAVCVLPAPDAADFVWLAGEAGLVVPLRQQARSIWHIPLARCYAVPYWRLGKNEEAYHQQRHEFIDN